jgi:hypothetical protein
LEVPVFLTKSRTGSVGGTGIIKAGTGKINKNKRAGWTAAFAVAVVLAAGGMTGVWAEDGER